MSVEAAHVHAVVSLPPVARVRAVVSTPNTPGSSALAVLALEQVESTAVQVP